jgi:Ca2+-transporting ATPase
MCKRGGASEFELVAGTSLVPGDLIHVRIGDKIPADCRVVKVDIDSETGLPCFQVDQSALTGESQFTTKTTVTETPEAVPRRNTCVFNPNLSQLNLEASNLVFLGTLCADGGADLLVVKTGSDCMFAILSSLFVR